MVAFSIFKIGMAIYRFMNPVVGATIFEPNTSIAVSAFGSLMFMILINISFVYMDHDFLQSKILKMSTIDPLTKIHNRRYFMEQFECILCKSRKMHALAIIDLDDFKRVNDTYGHVMGDEVLYEFSTFLKDRIRHGDILARYGGEEFILLLEINNEDEVRLFMDRIIKDLKDIKLSKEKIPMTFSGGVILLDEMEKDMKKIIAVADERLYHAKETGKKRIVYA